MNKRRKNTHYVNNKDFYKALKDHRERYYSAEASGDPLPEVSEYIGICFLEMANRISRKSLFAGYPFKDEMIGDAVANCLEKVLKFDPDVGDNPFAYFTTVISNAFWKRRREERHFLYTKLISYKNFNENLDHIPEDFKLMFEGNSDKEFDKFAEEFIQDFEEKKKIVKKTNEK